MFFFFHLKMEGTFLLLTVAETGIKSQKVWTTINKVIVFDNARQVLVTPYFCYLWITIMSALIMIVREYIEQSKISLYIFIFLRISPVRALSLHTYKCMSC